MGYDRTDGHRTHRGSPRDVDRFGRSSIDTLRQSFGSLDGRSVPTMPATCLAMTSWPPLRPGLVEGWDQLPSAVLASSLVGSKAAKNSFDDPVRYRRGLPPIRRSRNTADS